MREKLFTRTRFSRESSRQGERIQTSVRPGPEPIGSLACSFSFFESKNSDKILFWFKGYHHTYLYVIAARRRCCKIKTKWSRKRKGKKTGKQRQTGRQTEIQDPCLPGSCHRRGVPRDLMRQPLPLLPHSTNPTPLVPFLPRQPPGSPASIS